MDRELRNKHESLWKGRVDNILEDLEGAKLSIHNLMQENMALKAESIQDLNFRLDLYISNMSYLTDSYIIFTLKLESGQNFRTKR